MNKSCSPPNTKPPQHHAHQQPPIHKNSNSKFEFQTALGLYGFISFLMAGPALLLTALARLEAAPPMDAPWLSVSVAEYWCGPGEGGEEGGGLGAWGLIEGGNGLTRGRFF